jgi:hypothetical protein
LGSCKHWAVLAGGHGTPRVWHTIILAEGIHQVEHRLTIAGQIGLIPPTLTLPSPQSFFEEAVLSLQHVRRIMAVLRSSSTAGGGWEGWVEGVICWYARTEDLSLAQSIWESHAAIVSRSSDLYGCLKLIIRCRMDTPTLLFFLFRFHSYRKVLLLNGNLQYTLVEELRP